MPAADMPARDLETATRALTGMGFRSKEVRAALDRIADAGSAPPSIEDPRRAALRVLT